MVTVTPGITASDASVTRPLMAPVPDVTAWAKVKDEKARSNDKASANARRMGTLQVRGLRPMDERRTATPPKTPRILRFCKREINTSLR
jgi:hypothetical protein